MHLCNIDNNMIEVTHALTSFAMSKMLLERSKNLAFVNPG